MIALSQVTLVWKNSDIGFGKRTRSREDRERERERERFYNTIW